MTNEEHLKDGHILLLRQIHPTWIQDGEVSTKAFEPLVGSIAFKPSKEHDFKLSTAHGDLIHPQEVWERHTRQLGKQSRGVMAVSVAECLEQQLPAIHDRYEFDDHVSIDFNGLSNGQRGRKASSLRDFAQDRGWQFLSNSD